MIYTRESSRRGRGCGCYEPRQALLVAERAVLVASARGERAASAAARAVKDKMIREVRTMGEHGHTAPGTKAIILAAGKDSPCRPFLKVEKDPIKFAACNALADEIGPLDDPKQAFKLIEEAIGDEINEVFGLVTLDIHLRMKSVAETGRGEQDAVMAPMVPTLQAALIDGAHAIILFHVHPSGVKAEPSDADKETTQAFVDACEVVNINLIDHIIVGGDIKKRSYYSFAEARAL